MGRKKSKGNAKAELEGCPACGVMLRKTLILLHANHCLDKREGLDQHQQPLDDGGAANLPTSPPPGSFGVGPSPGGACCVLAELLTWPPRRWLATATPRLLHTLLLSLPAPPPNSVPAPLPPPPPLPSPAGSGGGVLHPASGAAAGGLPACLPAAAARADVGS